jgi:predicted nuclease with RNAse H fold
MADPRPAAHVLGLDLAGPANAGDTAAALCRTVDGRLELVTSVRGLTDADIAALLPPDGDLVAGLDAPLSYQPGGGDRAGDRELRARLRALGLPGGTVMAPTMTRMAYLTLRGIAVARLITGLRPAARIVEVHPAGALAMRGAPIADVREMKRSSGARGRLIAWLDRRLTGPGLAGDAGDHEVAAAAAALAAWDWSRGRPAWSQAAEPPHHPFAYAC